MQVLSNGKKKKTLSRICSKIESRILRIKIKIKSLLKKKKKREVKINAVTELRVIILLVISSVFMCKLYDKEIIVVRHFLLFVSILTGYGFYFVNTCKLVLHSLN